MRQRGEGENTVSASLAQSFCHSNQWRHLGTGHVTQLIAPPQYFRKEPTNGRKIADAESAPTWESTQRWWLRRGPSSETLLIGYKQKWPVKRGRIFGVSGAGLWSVAEAGRADIGEKRAASAAGQTIRKAWQSENRTGYRALPFSFLLPGSTKSSHTLSFEDMIFHPCNPPLFGCSWLHWQRAIAFVRLLFRLSAEGLPEWCRSAHNSWQKVYQRAGNPPWKRKIHQTCLSSVPGLFCIFQNKKSQHFYYVNN